MPAPSPQGQHALIAKRFYSVGRAFAWTLLRTPIHHVPYLLENVDEHFLFEGASDAR
jgi:hypothetical protein